jgi:uncharacterized membrane protein
MLRWSPAVMTLCGYALSLAVYRQLPDAVTLGLDGLFPIRFTGRPDAVPRSVAAFGLPTLALLVFLLLYEAPVSPLGRAAARLLPVRDPSGAARPVEYHKFAPTYRLIVAWVVMLVLSMHLAVLSSALGWYGEPGAVVGIVLGLGLVIVGNAMPRLRPNPVAGIRTARTMADPKLWARIHRVYGAFWMVAGIVVLIVAITAPHYAIVTAVAAFLLSSLPVLAGLRMLPAAIILAALALPISGASQRWIEHSSPHRPPGMSHASPLSDR